MSINKWIYEIKDIIDNNKWKSKFEIISCIDDDDICLLELKMNNYQIKIISDFKTYCYIENISNNNIPLDEVTLEELNLIILYSGDKEIYSILNSIDNYDSNNNSDLNIYDDIYNYYNNLDEKIKINIDYNLLEIESKKVKSKNKINLNKNIPKELLLNNNQIYNIIMNEIKIINRNFKYEHYIFPFENNIYDLRLRLIFDKKINNYNFLELKIEIDPDLYPFYPPKIEIITPNISLELLFTILNLNIFKIKNWKSTISLEWIAVNIVEKLNLVLSDHINNIKYNTFEYLILLLKNLSDENLTSKLLFELEYDNITNIPDISSSLANNNVTGLKAGIGYGNNFSSLWDINNFIQEKEIKKLEIVKVLSLIRDELLKDITIFNFNSYLINYIISQLYEINLLHLTSNNEIYIEIINILHIFNDSIINIDQLFLINIVQYLENINEEILLLFQNNEETINNQLFCSIRCIYDLFNDKIIKEEVIIESVISNKIENNIISYEKFMKPLQFSILDNINFSKHLFAKNKNIKIGGTTINRIISEFSSLKLNLPLNYDSTIWIRISKSTINLLSFIISGPKNTPYENGLFEFHTILPSNYPNIEPMVLLKTTGNGSVRFNPNLYNCGKVCLSLLGTWSGRENERWNAKTSTFLQVLVSIQSLILVEDPYFNEPGYEKNMNKPEGISASLKYNREINLQTIIWAMIDQLKNPPEEYKEIIIEHFKRKKNDILIKIDNIISTLEISNKLYDQYNNQKIIITKLLNDL